MNHMVPCLILSADFNLFVFDLQTDIVLNLNSLQWLKQEFK
jgi:hypothetical protein